MNLQDVLSQFDFDPVLKIGVSANFDTGPMYVFLFFFWGGGRDVPSKSGLTGDPIQINQGFGCSIQAPQADWVTEWVEVMRI